MTSKNSEYEIEGVVYVVHAVDTEGPLYESFMTHFERVNESFGLNINPSRSNLKKLRNKEIDLGGCEEQVRQMLSGTRIETNSGWDQIDRMLDEITSDEYRNKLTDSVGGGWVFNWFCLDHVGITGDNPRRRDMGYHNVHDHYHEYFALKQDSRDLIQWHYHPLSLTNDAHRAGSTYLNSSHIYEILSRRIIERSWFPAAFRAGHHVERPDSHFFLEQWIPFDFSNDSGTVIRANRSKARYGDWRKAPSSWIPYHPAHEDYQKVGSCRRFIARCLPITERAYTMTMDDVSQAFAEASKYGASILSFTNHDFRDMKPDIERARDLIKSCQKKNLNINFRFATAIDAMRGVFTMKQPAHIGFNVVLKTFKTHTRLIVEAEHEIFGTQPYLALKIKGWRYFWQNFDFEDSNVWSYSFDRDNIFIDQVAAIGIAANTSSGITEIVNIDTDTAAIKKTILNG